MKQGPLDISQPQRAAKQTTWAGYLYDFILASTILPSGTQIRKAPADQHIEPHRSNSPFQDPERNLAEGNLLNLDLSNIFSQFVFFDHHSDDDDIVVGGINYNYNYNDLLKIGFIIYHMYSQK